MRNVIRLSAAASEVADPPAGVRCNTAAIAHSHLVSRGYIHYYRIFSEVTQSYKSALMLGHAIYLTRYWSRRHPERDGWFWAAAADWTSAVGLTTREQESVRSNLRELGIWEEAVSQQWCGPPARLHCKLNLATLARLTGFAHADSAAGVELLTRSFAKPILFFRSLADIAGGPAPGLLLSQLISLLRAADAQGLLNEHGYFKLSFEESREDLGFTEKVYRTAVEKLRRPGWIQWDVVKGPKRSAMVRVNVSALIACLEAQSCPSKPIMALMPTAAPACIENTNVTLLPGAPQQQTGRRLLVDVLRHRGLLTQPPARNILIDGVDQDGQLVNGGSRHGATVKCGDLPAVRPLTECLFVDSLVPPSSPFVEPGPPFCRIPIQNKELQNTSSRTPSVDKSTTRRSRSFDIWDTGKSLDLSGIEPVYRNGASKIVQRAEPSDRQKLLDELVGYMQQPRRISNPLGWLFKLTEKCIEGQAVFALADSVAATRRAGVDKTAVRQQVSAPTDALSTPESAELARQGRAKMLEIRQRLKSQAAAKCSTPVLPDSGHCASSALLPDSGN